LRKVASKQTDRQTSNDENKTSLAEVIRKSKLKTKTDRLYGSEETEHVKNPCIVSPGRGRKKVRGGNWKGFMRKVGSEPGVKE